MITPKTDSLKTRLVTQNQPIQTTPQRDQAWLEAQLALIWRNHFSDVVQANTVTISWGRASRTRLGSIKGRGGKDPKNNPETSFITINRLLQDTVVPESVVWQTIAHELAHYTHGFCSPHPQQFAHPHRGDVVTKELVARGLKQHYNEAEIWLKTEWHNYIKQHLGTKPSRKRKTYGKRIRIKLSFLQNRGTGTIGRRGMGR